MNLSTAILIIILWPSSSFAYESFSMIIKHKDKVVSRVEIQGPESAISTPDKAWTCKTNKSHEFIKALEQDITHLIATCKSGDIWFKTTVSCANQVSKFNGTGYPKINTSDIPIGNKKNAFVFTLTCSTISMEKLEHEIEKILKETK